MPAKTPPKQLHRRRGFRRTQEGFAAQQLLRGVLVVVAAVGGFYSGYAPPRNPAFDLQQVPELAAPPAPRVGAPTGLPPGPSAQAAAPPAPSPLDFMREGLAERPTTVEALIAEVKMVADRLIERFPDQPDALEITGRLHFRLGDSKKASAAWERCLELNPNYGYAYHGLAMVADKKGEADQAAELFRQALIHNPERHETQIELAMVLIELDALDEAVALLERNVESDPRPYRGRVLLGTIYNQRREFEQAKEQFEAAIASHRTHANAHLGLARALNGLGEKERAQELKNKYTELLASERRLAEEQRVNFDDLETMCIDVAGTYFEAATICFAVGILTDAEVLSLRASILDPKNVKCRQALAYIYLQINQPAETIRVLEELAALEPQNVGYPVEIARLYVALGQMQPAEQTLRRICGVAPASEVVNVAQAAAEQAGVAPQFVVLSIASELNDDREAARAAIGKAIELAPDNPAFQQRQAALAP